MAELSVVLRKEPQVLSLDPKYLGDVLDDIRRVGRATGTEDARSGLPRGLPKVDAKQRDSVQSGAVGQAVAGRFGLIELALAAARTPR